MPKTTSSRSRAAIDHPVADSYEEFVSLSQGDQAEALAASVKRGQELFVGKIANCSKCHGEKGRGDGQTTDYDDWTKDWTSRVGLKPEDRESLIPLLARGALPPINAKPRNLEDGLFHGGSTAADLYRRIMMGIEGSPMPAATFVEGQFEQDDVWHLINFMRSLQKAEPDVPAVQPRPALAAFLANRSVTTYRPIFSLSCPRRQRHPAVPKQVNAASRRAKHDKPRYPAALDLGRARQHAALATG